MILGLLLGRPRSAKGCLADPKSARSGSTGRGKGSGKNFSIGLRVEGTEGFRNDHIESTGRVKVVPFRRVGSLQYN